MPNKEEPVKEKGKNSDHQLHPLHPSWRNPWVILAGVLVLGFILVSLGSASLTRTYTTRSGFNPGGPMQYSTGSGGQATNRTNFSRLGSGGYVYGSTGTVVSGVVTAVSSNTLTVAGGGTTESVDTSSSTTYTNATSAAVDDTVIATGSTASGTFTATRIIVNP